MFESFSANDFVMLSQKLNINMIVTVLFWDNRQNKNFAVTVCLDESLARNTMIW